MNFLALLALLSGSYLTTTGLKNRNPRLTLVAFIQGKPLPTEPWFALPPKAGYLTGENGTIWGRDFPSRDDVTGDTQGGPRQPSSSARSTVVNFAMAQRGDPYVWAAAGPDKWDCSGLVMRAYQQVGINLPHHAASQQTKGRAVGLAAAQPGDLIFWGPISSHVAMYIGNGQVVHAPKRGDVVKVSPLYDKKNIRVRAYL